MVVREPLNHNTQVMGTVLSAQLGVRSVTVLYSVMRTAKCCTQCSGRPIVSWAWFPPTSEYGVNTVLRHNDAPHRALDSLSYGKQPLKLAPDIYLKLTSCKKINCPPWCMAFDTRVSWQTNPKNWKDGALCNAFFYIFIPVQSLFVMLERAQETSLFSPWLYIWLFEDNLVPPHPLLVSSLHACQ